MNECLAHESELKNQFALHRVRHIWSDHTMTDNEQDIGTHGGRRRGRLQRTRIEMRKFTKSPSRGVALRTDWKHPFIPEIT